MSLPKDVVGETVPVVIGSVETDLRIDSYRREFTTVSYKQNVVHVEAFGGGSTRRGGVVGRFTFSMTQDKWVELNRYYRHRNDTQEPKHD